MVEMDQEIRERALESLRELLELQDGTPDVIVIWPGTGMVYSADSDTIGEAMQDRWQRLQMVKGVDNGSAPS